MWPTTILLPPMRAYNTWLNQFASYVWIVAEPEERTINAMIDLAGQHRTLWGSDFPHIDSTPAAPNLIRESIRKLTPICQAKLLGGNTSKLFF
jgi:predicted TIM-barrel fold metal-dependent hydrolase